MEKCDEVRCPAPVQQTCDIVEGEESMDEEPAAFFNDLIRDCIFQHLPNRDLVTCGLVNKKWNWNSRVFLQEKRSCLAKVQGCVELKELHDLIASSTLPIPFNGLFITGEHKCGNEISPEAFCKLFCDDLGMFRKLKLKLLRHSGQDCPLLEFIKKFFLEGSSLEDLEIISLPQRRSTLGETFPDAVLYLKNLQTIKFPIRKSEGLVEEILRAGSNLKTILGPVGEEELVVVNENQKIKALKEFLMKPEGPSQMEILSEQLLLEKPKLQYLEISSGWYRSNGGDLAFYNNLARSVLLSSSETLESLKIGHLDMILLTSTEEMPILKRLRHISLGYSFETDILEEYPTLKRINFQYYFPNLESIEIIATAAPRHTSWYITNDFRNSLEEFFCLSVRKLQLTGIDFPPNQNWFDWMRQLFPNVKEFEIIACNELNSYLTSAWRTWPDLVQFNVKELGGKFGKKNLDAAFCGLTEEEIQELVVMGEDSLRVYQYAPVSFSLGNLSHLKTLRFHAQHCKSFTKSVDTEFLTSLTGYLVLRRLKNIDVQLILQECQASCKPCAFLEDLKPFVKIRYQ